MLRVGLVALSVVYLTAFVVLAAIRSRVPFELEWMEGGLVDEIGRVLAGQKLYVAPTVEFAPFIYTPLYFWVSAAFAKVVGHGFFAPRLVSLLSCLGIFVMIGRLVQRETGKLAMGIVAAGLYAATFHRTAQLMDLVRTDSLFVLLLLVGIDRLRAGPNTTARVTAGLVFTLTFLTNQRSLPIVAALCVYVVLEDRRRAWPFLLAALGGIAGSVFVLDWAHQGWFRFYVFELPASHGLIWQQITRFWVDDIFGALAIAFAAGAYVFLVPDALEASPRRLWAFALAGALASSYSGRLHSGGWTNVLMPSYAILAVLFGVATERLFAQATEPRLARVVFVAAATQLLMLAYDPVISLPTRAERVARAQLVAKVRAVPGDAWIPTHGHLAVQAGKRAFIHQMAADDILRQEGPVAAELRAGLAAALRKKQFSLLITDNDFCANDVNANYVKVGLSYDRSDVGYDVTGVRYRAGELFAPRP